MRQIFYTLCMLLPLSTTAQLTDGSFAPDFTLQDLHGNTWNLYELLDQGKNVIIDFSATWCGPCWSYHESGIFNDVYAAYGPQGTDEFMVFMIEGDPETNLDCLYDFPGCNFNSQGDWTAGTLYPIINDDLIAWEYDINYWPTLFHICPNKLVTELHHPTAEEIYALKDECAVAVGDNNASVVGFASYTGAFCGSIIVNPIIEVQNLGLDPMVSATAECYVNDVLRETVQWTGHVIPFATSQIAFDSIAIVANSSVRISITSVNGAADADLTNNEIIAQLTQHPARAQNTLQLELITYFFPEEVYWELTNSDSAVLYKGGNPKVLGKEDDGGTYTVSDTTYSILMHLPGDGCYRFTIYDTAGYGLRQYKITDPIGDIVAYGVDFTHHEHTLIGIDNATNPVVDNGAISRINGFPGEFCSHFEYPLTLDLLNLGTDYITQAEIELSENGHVLDAIEWTGNLPPGEVAVISAPAMNFEAGKHIRFQILSINGVPDTFSYQNVWEKDLARNVSNDHAISIDMQLDHWAHEIYWQLTNSNGDVIHSGGNELVGPDGGGSTETQPGDPGAYGPDQYLHLELNLPDTAGDCYELLLVDGYGDGLYFGGFIRIKERPSGRVVCYKDYSYIEFETATTLLDVDVTGTSTEVLSYVDALMVYPNPAQSEIQVQFEMTRAIPLTLSIVNLLGEIVLQFPEATYSIGAETITLDVSAMAPGVYFLNLVSGNQQVTKKLTVMR
jgi:thiol-disulfide isomerase/thioredoxin